MKPHLASPKNDLYPMPYKRSQDKTPIIQALNVSDEELFITKDNDL